MRRLAVILAGAALLAWPALVNGYPLVFSDTAGLADMGLEPNMGWDKPWVYGPLILLLHWSRSLWGVVAGQVLVVSAVLWLVGRTIVGGGAWRHIVLCAVLAIGSAAPWFATFVMPDIFAPLAVLCVVLLAWGRLGRLGTAGVMLLGTIAIAVHLAHLIVAAGCLVAVLLARPRRLLLCAVPLVAALAWLIGEQHRRQRRGRGFALRLGVRIGPATGRRAGRRLPPQCLPGGRVSGVRLGRPVADGQR